MLVWQGGGKGEADIPAVVIKPGSSIHGPRLGLRSQEPTHCHHTYVRNTRTPMNHPFWVLSRVNPGVLYYTQVPGWRVASWGSGPFPFNNHDSLIPVHRNSPGSGSEVITALCSISLKKITFTWWAFPSQKFPAPYPSSFFLQVA